MAQDHLAAMMKTIFSLLIIFISFTSISQELFSVNFKIENNGQSSTKLNAQASSLSNKVIRNHAYIALISPEEVNNNIKDCWKEFIINREVKIETRRTKFKQINSNKKFHTYQITLNPEKIKITNVSSTLFRKYCSIWQARQNL